MYERMPTPELKFFAIVIGIPLGILMARSDRAQSIINPILDIMQTLPSFVYLIPVVMVFGIGKVPGVIAVVTHENAGKLGKGNFNTAHLLAGPLGCLVVWRRMAYFGDTMAHSALLGVALCSTSACSAASRRNCCGSARARARGVRCRVCIKAW